MPVPTVLLVTSNGAGLGHLARAAAVAEVLRARGTEPVLLSMSAALPLVTRGMALRGEHLPGPHRGWVGLPRWQRYLADRLVALARETGARAVLYDGVAPYAGLLLARAALPDVPFAWSRRGFWKPGTNRRALWAASAFDLVVEPGDLCAAADAGVTRGRTDALRVAPVSLAGVLEPLPRDAARRALGLDPDRPAALVSLGTALRGDLDAAAAAAVRALRAAPDDWQVAATALPLRTTRGTADAADAAVHGLAGTFPLAPLLPAFDLAVAAAGYNAVHELLPMQVPTLLVTKHRGTDDQERRAAYAAARGWALAAADDDPAAVTRGTTRLLHAGERHRLAAACADLPPVDGARAAAAALTRLAADPAGHSASAAERLARAELVARSAVRARLPGATPGHRGAAGPPALATDVTHDELLGETPVEHLVTGAAPGYARERERIAAAAYATESSVGRTRPRT